MIITIRILMIALLCNCFVIVVFSQKKTQITPQQRRENAIQYAFSEMENSLKRGDYEKAYDISTRLSYSLNSYEKKQRANENNKQAKKLLNLRYEAYNAIRDKNYKLAQLRYEAILRENPTDNITKNDKANLISIINQPKDNILDKVLAGADKLFDDATNSNNKNSIAEIENKLLKARKIWSVIALTSPNYQKDIITKNISATDEILKSNNSIRTAIKNGNLNKAIQLAKGLEAKYDEVAGLPSEMIREAKDNQSKYIGWRKEAENAFYKLDYSTVLKRISKIKQLPGYEKDNYVKFNGRKFDVENILKAKQDIEKVKNDLGKTNMVLAFYENIFKINPFDKNDYFTFVKEKFNIVYASNSFLNSCENLIKYGMLLIRIDEQKAVSDGVKAKIDDCDKQIACIDKCRNIYQVAYNVANQLKNQGRLSEAERRLNEEIVSKESSIIDCKCDSILVKSRILLADINNQKRWNSCLDKANTNLKVALDNQSRNLFEEALKSINDIDTTCLVGMLDLLTQVKTQRKKIEFDRKEHLYIALRDSALIQESQKFYKDLFVLLGKAKEFHPDTIRLEEINNIIANKCCTYKGLESREKEELCSLCGENCCPSPPPLPSMLKDASQIKTFEIVVGGNFTNGYIQLNVDQNKGKSPFKNTIIGGNFGIRRIENNYTKMLDYRVGINCSYNTISLNTLLPTNLGSVLIRGDFNVLGLDIPIDLKWHGRKNYHDEPRYYMVTGVHFGKNNVLKTDSQSSFQDDIKSQLNSYYTGYKAGIGLDYNSKKWSFDLELNYQMKGNVYEYKQFSSPFNSNAIFHTFNLSLGFRVW
jgi:hypothetical protein